MDKRLLIEKLKKDELIKAKNEDYYKNKLEIGDFIFNILNDMYLEVITIEEDKINAKDKDGCDCYIKIEDIYCIDFDKTLKFNPYTNKKIVEETAKNINLTKNNNENDEEMIKLKEENLKLKNIIKEISSLL